MVVPPLVGHVNPTVGLGAALTEAGHEVAWVGYADLLDRLLPPDAMQIPLVHEMSEEAYIALRTEGAGLRGAAAFKFLWDRLFFPLTHAMVPGVDAAVQSFRPDVLVVDQQTFAGALVARRHGLPWVTSASTSANLVDPFESLPQLRQWMEDGIVALQEAHGLPGTPDGMLSPHAVLAWSTEALVGPGDYPDHWHFVGPALGARPAAPDFPWDRLQAKRKKVLISLGTVNAEMGGRFFREAMRAVADRDLQAIVVAPADLVPNPPANVLRCDFVPQIALLQHMHAVVSHAGHNTTVETLAHGLPMVVAPIRDDQPIVAQQVVASGAGIRVKFGRVKAEQLGAAIDAVLTEPAYKAAARAIRSSFVRAGGVHEAARIVLAATA